jgi:DTW domain-containing protein YfiP
VNNRTSVLVLQHPRERLHPIGTARLARLGLRNVRVEVAWNANQREEQPPAWLPKGAALLYPAKDARDLRELAPHEQPRHLVVIDGTWNTAHTLYRDKAWLHALPHYRFLPSAPGRYRIRREPQADYVSTIEAIVEALQILEPETQGLQALLGAFDAMIDYQLAHIARGAGGGRTRLRRRAATERRIPRSLIETFARLIVVYGESSRPGAGQKPELVYFAAVALASHAHFERIMLPASGMPDAQHMTHMGLSAAHFQTALSRGEFCEQWAGFLASCGFKPLLAAWNQRTLDLLAATTDTPPSRVSIKAAYRSVYGNDAHGLDEVVIQRGLHPLPNALHGRAARRLAGAVAVTRFLHARALGSAQEPNDEARATADSG